MAICKPQAAAREAAVVQSNQTLLWVFMAHGFTTAAAMLVHGALGTAIAAVCQSGCNGEIKATIQRLHLQAAQIMEKFMFDEQGIGLKMNLKPFFVTLP